MGKKAKIYRSNMGKKANIYRLNTDKKAKINPLPALDLVTELSESPSENIEIAPVELRGDDAPTVAKNDQSQHKHARVEYGLDRAAELLESTSENLEIEHVELRGGYVPAVAKNDQSQRQHTRVEYGDIKARFIVGTKPKRFRPFTRVFPCEVEDISMGGARIQSTKRLYKNETITLYFSPHGGEEEVTIAGEVVRTAGIDNALFKYGIQFFGTIPHGELQTIVCRKAIEKKVGGELESEN